MEGRKNLTGRTGRQADGQMAGGDAGEHRRNDSRGTKKKPECSEETAGKQYRTTRKTADTIGEKRFEKQKNTIFTHGLHDHPSGGNGL